MSLPVALGVDFGTSTTLVASPNGLIDLGLESTAFVSKASMPSVVAVADDGTVVAGEAATHYPAEQTVRSIKAAITSRREFAQVDTPSGPRDVSADRLMVELLRQALTRAETARQAPAAEVRIGCPAMWDGQQRRRLLEIAQRAGLPVDLGGLVDEPVAAGIAWLTSSPLATATPRRVVVFDMGGGTLDIAVLEVRGRHRQDRQELAVLAAMGVPEAGDALDDGIARDLDLVLATHGVDVDSLTNPARARGRLVHAAREAKEGLSVATEHPAVLPRRLFGVSEVWYTRDQLEQVFADQMDRAEQHVLTALMMAQLTERGSGSAAAIARTPVDELTEAVDVVLLSGGMSRIPYVRQRMQDLFGPKATVELAAAAPDTAVALGLARAPRFGRINMYRPAFDVLLQWEGGERTVYEAFTPLAQQRRFAGGGSPLSYVRSGRELALPANGTARLRMVERGGEPVRAFLDEVDLDGFPVSLGGERFEFRIHPDGRLQLTDAAGAYSGHIEGWHS